MKEIFTLVVVAAIILAVILAASVAIVLYLAHVIARDQQQQRINLEQSTFQPDGWRPANISRTKRKETII
jgi:hypothetical protein